MSTDSHVFASTSWTSSGFQPSKSSALSMVSWEYFSLKAFKRLPLKISKIYQMSECTLIRQNIINTLSDILQRSEWGIAIRCCVRVSFLSWPVPVLLWSTISRYNAVIWSLYKWETSVYSKINGKRLFQNSLTHWLSLGDRPRWSSNFFVMFLRLAFSPPLMFDFSWVASHKIPRAFKRLSLSASSAPEMIGWVFYCLCLIVHIQSIFFSMVIPKIWFVQGWWGNRCAQNLVSLLVLGKEMSKTS